jgi:hypothetical protein
MKFWTIALAALLAVGAVGVAEARGGKGHKSDGGAKAKGTVSLAKLDTNGDGKVSKEEWDAAFAKLDQNGDGSLTSDDLKGKHGKHQGKHPGQKGGRKNR